MPQFPSPAQAVTTRAHWFGEADEPTLSWLTEPVGSTGRSGVLLLPPIGYDYWTTHRAMRDLAERLAANGHRVLRIDYRGTGDSTGCAWAAGILGKWEDDVRRAVEELRGRGATSIALVGLRFGALLALNLLAEVGADAVVAWIPVVSGRRYVKELQLLSTPAPALPSVAGGSGTRFLAGCAFTTELLSRLASRSVEAVETNARILILDRPDRVSSAGLAEKWSEKGASAEQVLLDGVQTILDVPTEYAVTPTPHLALMADWLGRAPPEAGETSQVPEATWHDHARFLYEGRPLVEQAVRLGEAQLVGIECAGADGGARGTVVFLNTGSEPHVGPGRAWVELARDVAARGWRTIRVDYQGWGESPDNGYAPGQPYDAHAVADTLALARALVDRGDRRIVLVGLCASAWIALRDGASLPVHGIVAFNPQLYWQTGDPVWATMPESIEWCHRDDDNVWADPLRRSAVRRWFEAIQAAPFPVDFWFERDDPGIQYLRGPLSHAIPPTGAALGAVTIHEFEYLDHAMHRHWHRSEALDAIMALLGRVSD